MASSCRYAKQYFNNDIVAAVAVVGGVFLVTLLVVSVLTIRISDMVLDSRVGALDRTLGFLFGLGRGLIIVVVAFQFFTWLVPDRSQPDWVKSAKSQVVLAGTGQWLMSHVAGRPGKHHLEEAEAAAAGGHRHPGCRRRISTASSTGPCGRARSQPSDAACRTRDAH